MIREVKIVARNFTGISHSDKLICHWCQHIGYQYGDEGGMTPFSYPICKLGYDLEKCPPELRYVPAAEKQRVLAEEARRDEEEAFIEYVAKGFPENEYWDIKKAGGQPLKEVCSSPDAVTAVLFQGKRYSLVLNYSEFERVGDERLPKGYYVDLTSMKNVRFVSRTEYQTRFG